MADDKKISPKQAAIAVLKKFGQLVIEAEQEGKTSLFKAEKKREDIGMKKAPAAPAAAPAAVPAAAVAPPAPPAAAPPAAPAAEAPKPVSSGNSPTKTNTETGGSSPGGASTGGVGSGIGGAGTGGAATGGAAPDEPDNFSTSGKDVKQKPAEKSESMAKSEKLQKDEAPPAPPADGQTINSQIGNPFGKDEMAAGEQPKEFKGHIKLAKFLGHIEGKRLSNNRLGTPSQNKVMPDSGNSEEHPKPIDQSSKAMGMQKADVLANKPGQVSAGGNIRSAHRSFEHAKNPNASSPKIEREMGREYSAKAKGQHKEKLAVIQNQPKPKLPR